MFLNNALSLSSSDLHLLQNVLDEAIDMHADSDLVAIRGQVLDVLQLNLDLPRENLLHRFGNIVDELLAHMSMPTEKLLLAIGVLREAGFDEQAELLRDGIYDRALLIRSIPALEQHLRDLNDRYPSRCADELHARHTAWRALEHLTFNARFGAPKTS